PSESNIATKYWVSASADTGNAALAIDGSEATLWKPAAAAAALTVDLGGAYDAVRKVETVFGGNTERYRYTLEGSADGLNWSVLADRSGNDKRGGIFTDVFALAGLRYLRLNVLAGAASGVRELRVVNYLRPDMDNGSDTSGIADNYTMYYNADNDPLAPDGIRGGVMNEASMATGDNFHGLTKDMGWDTIRLRIWNEPRSEGSWQPNMITKDSPMEAFPAGNPNGSCSPSATLTHAKYVVGAGQNLAIDFHYADSWSDPQNQPKPYAWADLPFESANPETNDLVKQTYAFTYEMVADLIEQGTTPTVVALGNEITNGMLWGSEYEFTNPYAHFHDYYKRFIRDNPNAARGGGVMWIKYEEAEGDKTSEEYAEFLDSIVHLAKLVDAGNRAIAQLNEDYDTNILTEMHFAFNVFEEPPGQPKVAMDPDAVYNKVVTLVGGLAENLEEMGGMVDRIGISYYPDWHGTFAQVQRNIVELSKMLPDVTFNIAECSPPASGSVTDWMNNPNYPVGYSYSIQHQGDDTMRIMELINDVPNNAGQGVWPWNGQSVYFTGGSTWIQNPDGSWAPVYFPPQPNASFKVWNDAFAKNVVESRIYAVTAKGVAPALPATVKSLDVATGVVADVPVVWDLAPADYAALGTVTVRGTAAPTVPETGRGVAMTAVTATVDVVNVRAHSSARVSLRIKGKAPLLFEAYGADCIFTSSDPKVVSVSETGVVTGLRAGTVLITLRSKTDPSLAHAVVVSVA
ncbi:MAG: glycosyl hydrolase 53 family protein, partial [Oscillospiraceae bacterium]|nr:glycosyl hydrolase 53 family protein [Oscillospiraceae bacterium]